MKNFRHINFSNVKNFRHMKIFGHWLIVDLWRMLVMLRCFGHYEGPTCLSCTGEPGHLLTGMLLTWQKASARVHTHDAKVALLSPTCNNILPARLFNRINFEILVYVKYQTRRAPGSLTGLIYWLTACAAAIILTGELKKNCTTQMLLQRALSPITPLKPPQGQLAKAHIRSIWRLPQNSK